MTTALVEGPANREPIPEPPPSADVESALSWLPERLGIEFRNRRLLEAALTHRSYAYERGLKETNERMELLGDAVLTLVITDFIYRTFPKYLEGDLAKLRASLVSAPALAEVAQELSLGSAIRLGKGEVQTGGKGKPSILADGLEAVIGAVYLDRGLTAARTVIRRLFWSRIAAAIGKDVPRDPKTQLQEYVTRLSGSLPRYKVTGEGPDHAKRFYAEVLVEGVVYGSGEGRSKKEAEQAAAAEAVARVARERAAMTLIGSTDSESDSGESSEQPDEQTEEQTGGSGGEPPIHRGAGSHADSGGPPDQIEEKNA